MQLRHLNIGYKQSAPIVSSIDADLLPSTFTCLLGRNGTGKSTLLMTLANQLSPLAGEVEGAGRCALVLPKMPDLQNTTVRELVCYGRLPYTGIFGHLKKSDFKAADEAIARVGIASLSDQKTQLLSDGERQKALIARGLAQGSETLLLDEPSAFLDYPSRRQLMQLLQDLAHREGKTILLSTHDVELATAYADQLWIIRDHQLKVENPRDFTTEAL